MNILKINMLTKYTIASTILLFVNFGNVLAKDFTSVETNVSICDPVEDSLSLVALYQATNGSNWITVWDLEQAMNTWHGVSLNDEGCVESLDLSENNLEGSLPTEISNLANLELLNLRHNQLEGNIPIHLRHLSNLITLNLQHNNLAGTIPLELTQLTTLEHLEIGGNPLTGNIPSEIGSLTNLKTLGIRQTLISGTIPIELANLDHLERLLLYNNQLSGNIPPELGNLSNLWRLSLYGNQLSGTIPPELGNLNVNSLQLHNNQLEGCFPIELLSLCGRSCSFSNNTGLPNDGDFSIFCEDQESCIEVWPGDANNSGRVDYIDALTAILKNGQSITPRPDTSIDWNAKIWEVSNPNSIGAAHADCNGNGIVSFEEEKEAIIRNYGKTVSNVSISDTIDETQDYTFFVEESNIQIIGDTQRITFDLMIKNNISQPISIAGIGFSINYTNASNPQLVIDNSQLVLPNDSFFIYSKPDTLDIAIGQLNGESTTLEPADTILVGEFIIDENIVTSEPNGFNGNHLITIHFNGIVLKNIDDAEYRLTENIVHHYYSPSIENEIIKMSTTMDVAQPSDITIKTSTTIPKNDRAAINVYPNPVKDKLFLSWTQVPLSDIYFIITDIYGKKILNKTIRSIETKQIELDLKTIPTGCYFITIMHDEKLRHFTILKS